MIMLHVYRGFCRVCDPSFCTIGIPEKKLRQILHASASRQQTGTNKDSQRIAARSAACRASTLAWLRYCGTSRVGQRGFEVKLRGVVSELRNSV